MKKTTPEGAILAQCLELLTLRGVLHWRQNTGAFAIGEGAARRFFRAGAPGISDILLVLPGGRFGAVEVKSAKGRIRAEQQAFLDNVNKAGGWGICIRSAQELSDALDEVSRQ